MISIKINSDKYIDSIYNTIRIFEKFEDVNINSKNYSVDKTKKIEDKRKILIDIKMNEECIMVSKLFVDSVLFSEESTYLNKLEFLNNEREKKISVLLRHNIYKILSKYYGKTYSYGILTGIRPVKIIRIATSMGYDKKYISRVLKKTFLLDETRIINLFNVYDTESSALIKDKQNTSLYIGIPFCPTKCRYCSFTSYIGKSKEDIESYLDILIKELEYNSNISRTFDLDIHSLYIGGGTPGILDEKMTYKLLESIHTNFKLKSGLEITMESGRPKTITKEKLLIMKDMGVDRISINPQTMNDNTLKAVNRDHNTYDIIKAFDIARSVGIRTINSDFIIGLPGEVLEDAKRNIDFIRTYSPENITVHNLSIKRGSYYHNNNYVNQPCEEALDQINEYYKNSLAEIGMHMYYLYRQKNMRNNADNFGYCFNSHESIYNINIIEEIQTILAAGAGAVTKVVDPFNNKIYRVANNKDLKKYSEKLYQVYLLKKKLISQILTDTK